MQPKIGQLINGGYYAGRFNLNGEQFELVIAPATEGRHARTAWGVAGEFIEGATSFNDGRANTEAMAAAGSELAQWALQLDIGGEKDWYIPSRDELEIIYRNLKLTAETNYVWRHGDNPSSVPVGYPYSENSLAQTTVAAFQEGGEQALDASWYWSSTQNGPSSAWIQDFDGGSQSHRHKSNVPKAFAVRRFPVTP